MEGRGRGVRYRGREERGGGGGRGHNRGGGRGWGRGGAPNGRGQPSERGFRGGGGHPRGLKGRDIGLWHARRSKEKREQFDVDNRAIVTLDKECEKNIVSLLDQIKSSSPDALKDETLVSFTKHETVNYSEHKRLLLKRDAQLDEELFEEITSKKEDKQFRKLLEFRRKLPSYDMREEISETIVNNQVVVISGETGCGKTTQVAQFILDDCIAKKEGSLCHVICTQPRRISAIAVAERVASERGERLGKSTGFQIRLESKQARERASIMYCTTGILLQRLITDPYLSELSHIILDEIHERNILSDFLMIIIKDLLPIRRDLKVILMSATLNAQQFSNYFGNCPMLHIPGFMYPVKEYYLEDIFKLINYTPAPNQQQLNNNYSRRMNDSQRERQQFLEYLQQQHSTNSFSQDTCMKLDRMNFDQIDNGLVVQLVMHISTQMQDGAILIFLPGWSEITKLHEDLKNCTMFNSKNFILIPLHSMMPTTNQKEVFDRPPAGVRKIILSTNIAETSITVDDVIYVIDCGKSKEKSYDAEANISCLQAVWVSKASAKQRRGRAGRVQEGHYFCLYTRYHAERFADYHLPEMQRTPLDQMCLQLKILRLGKIRDFLSKAMQSPDEQAVENAINSLTQMRALDDNENLTALGYHLAKLPVDPKVGRMILFGAIFSCLDPILTVAASLDFKHPFHTPINKQRESDECKLRLAQGSNSDHIMLINAFKAWERAKRHGDEDGFCWKNFLSKGTLRMISNMKEQFSRLLFDIGFVHSPSSGDQLSNIHAENKNLIKAVVCAGFYPNVAKVLHGNGKRPPKLLADPYGYVVIHPNSVNANETSFETQWLVYHEKMKTTKLFLHDCTVVSPFALLFFGGHICFHRDDSMDTIQVDQAVKFHSPQRIANLVKELRKELDRLLAKKVNNPQMELIAGHMSQSLDNQMLQTIIELITNEVVRTNQSSSQF